MPTAEKFVAHDYRVGEKLVYPGSGVAEVVRIEKRTIAGRDSSFYMLRPIGSDATIMIPTQNIDMVGLRTVMGPQRAKTIFQVLRQPAAVPSGPWNRRHREYQERLKSGEPESVASVVRDLMRTQTGKELSFSERKMLEHARGLLVTELALSLRKPEAAIDREIDKSCKS